MGSGVSMGPLSADTQPPPSSADSAWFLTKNSGFGLHDDETAPPPLKPPWFFEQETATELGSRFPFIFGFRELSIDFRPLFTQHRAHCHRFPCMCGARGVRADGAFQLPEETKGGLS